MISFIIDKNKFLNCILKTTFSKYTKELCFIFDKKYMYVIVTEDVYISMSKISVKEFDNYTFDAKDKVEIHISENFISYFTSFPKQILVMINDDKIIVSDKNSKSMFTFNLIDAERIIDRFDFENMYSMKCVKSIKNYNIRVISNFEELRNIKQFKVGNFEYNEKSLTFRSSTTIVDFESKIKCSLIDAKHRGNFVIDFILFQNIINNLSENEIQLIYIDNEDLSIVAIEPIKPNIDVKYMLMTLENFDQIITNEEELEEIDGLLNELELEDE